MPKYYSYNIIKDLYYDNVNFENESTLEEDVLKKYTNTENVESNEKYIELSDILTNVNGVHTYKLISSKDIDWENIYLPNSSVSDLNWGSFDKDRRWISDSPIHINDVYELMNVIDYLLCSCADLWSEINKLKFGNGNEIEIWFLKDASTEILKSNEIFSNDFKKGNTKGIQITYLDPTKYSSTLNIANFGIGTQFNTAGENASEYPIRRLILKYGNKNGIQGITREYQNDYIQSKAQSTSVQGQVVTIYGYKINNSDNNNEIKFFPGFNFDNFINTDKLKKVTEVVDNVNKKLKYNNIYFKSSRESNIYERIYCEFLENDNYILYYKDNSGSDLVKKIIYKSSDSINLNNYSEFSNANITSGHYYTVSSINYPWLFVCDEEFTLDLYVETPKIENKYEKSDKTITLYYYKDNNDINVNIYTENNTNNIVTKSEDLTQASSLLYDKNRYNIPDRTLINIDVSAKWISPNNNIKDDDEYLDYPVSIDDARNNYSTYYTYSHVDNNGQRVFTQLDYEEMVSWTDEATNKFTDTTNQNVVQLYIKNDHPYELKYNLSPNQLILQDNDYASVKQEINSIVTNNDIWKENNIIKINHELSNDFEQLKFNVDLEIEETSKVKGSSYTIPINLNKVHNPKLHYINWQDTYNEYMSYFDYDVYDITTTESNPPYCDFIAHSTQYGHKMYSAMNAFSLNSYVINGIYNNASNDYEFSYSQLSSNGNYILNFSYHPEHSYINLLGSNFTAGYLASKYNTTESIIKSTKIATIFNSGGSNINYNNISQSLFNIYDLGKNYRFEGGNDKNIKQGKYWDIDNGKLKYNINANRINTKTRYDNTSLNNISYFLNYKLSSNLFITDTYNYNHIRYNNSNEYFNNNIYNINTTLMNIYKTTYTTVYPVQVMKNLVSEQPIFIPIMYLDLLNSSMHPTDNELPSNTTTHKFDLNNNSDRQRYIQYINVWNDSNYYDTVTLNLQLKENLYRGLPFFNETNEATLNFKVKRCSDNAIIPSPTFEGKSWKTKLFVGQKYYLSNLIRGLTNNQYITNTISLGSYPEWNDTLQQYEIIDIYNQVSNFINYEDSRTYQYIDFIHKTNNQYDYDISKIAELNKFEISSIYITENNTNIDISNYSCMDIDKYLYTLKLDDTEINSLTSLLSFITTDYSTNNINILEPIVINISPSSIYGNTRYEGRVMTGIGARVQIIPLHRKKLNNNADGDPSFITIELPDPINSSSTIELELFKYDESETYKTYNSQSQTYTTIPKTTNKLHQQAVIEAFEAYNLFTDYIINQINN